MKHSNNTSARIAIVLLVIQLMLMLVSWLINAAAPHLPLRSLLSSEGVRWLFGNFTQNVLSPVLAYAIYVSAAYGVFKSCLMKKRNNDGNNIPKNSIWSKWHLLMIIPLGVLAVLTIPRHAILRGVDGTLCSSSFFRALIPIFATLVIIWAIISGASKGNIKNVYQAYRMMAQGCKELAWWLPVYVIAIELWESFRFVFLYYD